MAHYFASFEEVLPGIDARFDTRIYFQPFEPGQRANRCIGAVVCKNPGAAKPVRHKQWCELDLGNDKTLPRLKAAFGEAFRSLRYSPKCGDYLQVQNLFLICDSKLNRALEKHRRLLQAGKHLEDANLQPPPFLFFAWGSNLALQGMKRTFLTSFNQKPSFFVSYSRQENRRKFDFKVKTGPPAIDDKVKHPQGLPHQCVVEGMQNLWPQIRQFFES